MQLSILAMGNVGTYNLLTIEESLMLDATALEITVLGHSILSKMY